MRAGHAACRCFVRSGFVYRRSGFSPQTEPLPWASRKRQRPGQHPSPSTPGERRARVTTPRPPAPVTSDGTVSEVFLPTRPLSPSAPFSVRARVTGSGRVPAWEIADGKKQGSFPSERTSHAPTERVRHFGRPRGKRKSPRSSTPFSPEMSSKTDSEQQAALSRKSRDRSDIDERTYQAPTGGQADGDFSTTGGCRHGSDGSCARTGTRTGICFTSGANKGLHGGSVTEVAAENPGDTNGTGAIETLSTSSSAARESSEAPVPRLLKKPQPPWKPDPSDW